MAKQFRDFESARKFVRGLALKTQKEWRVYCKTQKPKNIPSNPARTYAKKGWISWKDWLGYKRETALEKRSKFLSISLAKKKIKKIVVENNITSGKKFLDYVRKTPIDGIPLHPPSAYANAGWTIWGDFLGTGSVATWQREYISYDEAIKKIHKLKLNSIKEWTDFCKNNKKWLRENKIPANPTKVYGSKFLNIRDWLGSKNIRPSDRKFRSFVNSKKYAIKQKCKNKFEWYIHARSDVFPIDVPKEPQSTYANSGWEGWGDFLGTGNKSPTEISKNYLPWTQAKKEYQRLAKVYGFKNLTDWKKFAKTHSRELNDLNLPAQPWNVYTKEKVWEKMNDG